MTSTAERYNSLAGAYIKLSDEFHQLDVAHMNLKQKLLPAIKAIKTYQSLTHQLQQDNAKLELSDVKPLACRDNQKSDQPLNLNRIIWRTLPLR